MKKFLLISILISLLFSCQKPKIDELFLYPVEEKNFEDCILTQGTVEAVQSFNIICPRNIEGKIIFIIEDGCIVKSGDTICIIEDQNLQNRYDNAVTNFERTEAQYRKTEADLNMRYAVLEAQVQNNKAETQIAHLDSAQLKFLTPNQQKIKLLELDRVEIERKKLDKKFKALKIIQQSELRRLEFRLKRMENEIQNYETQINSLTITSPLDGLAIRSRSWLTGNKILEGDQIWGNMPIVSIPNMDKMKVLISATESQYKRIETGDSVSYSFDALPDNFAFGKISAKSPMGTPASKNSKVKFFEITATLDSANTLPEPGLSANCKIFLKYISDTIVVPRIAVFNIDSMDYVFIQNKQRFIQQEVELANSNLKEVIISKGLKYGDKISLIKPEKSMISQTIQFADSLSYK